jgi:uncharacterized membrane protein
MKLQIEFKKLLTIFLVGFITYIGFEVIFTAVYGEFSKLVANPFLSLQGFSSLWMGVVGGLLLIILGKFNEIDGFHLGLPMLVQSLIGCVVITLIELLSGCILNLYMGLNLWDYSYLPWNLWGQINVGHSLYWLLLSPFAFWLDDLLRWIFYRTGNFKSEVGIHIVKVKSLLHYYKSLFSFKNPYDYIDKV